MIDFDFSKHCCGCAVCVDLCPRHCISIVEDSKDFRIPKVNADECINCGLCENVCPILNSEIHVGLEKLFCCYNKDEIQRKSGSSGSVFVLLAENVIEANGIVVGAAFDEHLQLRHQVAHNLDEVRPLMKSKYVQSDTTGIYQKVKEIVNQGSQCLFVGTPCQCNALYNFLGQKKYNNLLIVDFICHGVPSQKLFDKAINSFEKKRNCKVQTFNFREKSKGVLHCYSVSYIYNDSKELETDVGLPNEFPFYNGYLKYNIFRECCYECRFARKERVSDLTLGDFWNLTSIRKEISDFRKGYSMVIVNTENGMKHFQGILSKMIVDEFPIEVAEKCNFAYTHSTKKKLLHKYFLRDYNVKPFSEVEKRYMCAHVGFRQDILTYLIEKLKI